MVLSYNTLTSFVFLTILAGVSAGDGHREELITLIQGESFSRTCHTEDPWCHIEPGADSCNAVVFSTDDLKVYVNNSSWTLDILNAQSKHCGQYKCGDQDFLVKVLPKDQNDDIRLNSPYNSKDKGLVEVRVDGRWGPLCGGDIGPTEATVICNQLGYSDADEYYQEAEEAFDVNKNYNETFYIGLTCRASGGRSRISDCEYDIRIGTKSQCTRSSSYGYGGVSCKDDTDYTDFGFFDMFRYLGWTIMIFFIALMFWIVRNRTYHRRLRAQQQQAAAAVAMTNGQSMVVPPPRTTATSALPPGTYPTQPAPPPGSYPTAADAPPKYDAVVPQPGSATYPQGGMQYLQQGTGTPYPSYGVQQGVDNPVFPPSNYTASTDASAPAFPPPAYETIASDAGGGPQQPKT